MNEKLNCRLALYAPELFAHVKNYLELLEHCIGYDNARIAKNVQSLIDTIEAE